MTRLDKRLKTMTTTTMTKMRMNCDNNKITTAIWLAALVVVVLPSIKNNGCTAILPTAGIDIRYFTGDGSHSRIPMSQTLLASQASFGNYPSMGALSGKLLTPVFPPDGNDDQLCNINAYSRNTRQSAAVPDDLVMLVARGNCTFEQKAVNAEALGASVIIIYGTLGSRYSWNETASQQIWPGDKLDYDCNNGRALIDTSSLQLSPYYGKTNDQLLTGPNSLCASANPTDFADSSSTSKSSNKAKCPTQRCLLTGNITSTSTTTLMEACCAWDLHVWLYDDPTFVNKTVTIQAFYITMEQHQIIINIMSQSGAQNVSLVPYSRSRPTYNSSAVLIWVLGVFVAWLASYLSAQDYRQYRKGISSITNDNDPILYTELAPDEATTHESSSERGQHDNSTTSTMPVNNNHQYGEETLELTWHHAIAFLVFSSSSLFILFFFKLYTFVKIFYGIGCSGALVQVIFLPLYTKLDCYYRTHKCTTKLHTNGGGSHTNNKQPLVLFTLCDEKITIVDILSVLSGYGIGIVWIVLGFVMPNSASSLPFYWITQDIMGACMCIVFLGIIRLNSIKVATILLLAAFVYDIFFVFITPLIFNQSIMIAVATSGGPPSADPTWCEKYPSDKDCQGGEPLPMLFAIPRIGDFEGGASLLGLGDVVLPGLLLSFASRIDCAKALIGLKGGGEGISSSNKQPRCAWTAGYFYPVLIAYAFGLLMANAAVYIMQMGQPALLYLVPMCLGTICTLGWMRGEFSQLWNGPKVLLAADQIVSSTRENHVEHHHELVDANGHEQVVGVSA